MLSVDTAAKQLKIHTRNISEDTKYFNMNLSQKTDKHTLNHSKWTSFKSYVWLTLISLQSYEHKYDKLWKCLSTEHSSTKDQGFKLFFLKIIRLHLHNNKRAAFWTSACQQENMKTKEFSYSANRKSFIIFAFLSNKTCTRKCAYL